MVGVQPGSVGVRGSSSLSSTLLEQARPTIRPARAGHEARRVANGVARSLLLVVRLVAAVCRRSCTRYGGIPTRSHQPQRRSDHRVDVPHGGGRERPTATFSRYSLVRCSGRTLSSRCLPSVGTMCRVDSPPVIRQHPPAAAHTTKPW